MVTPNEQSARLDAFPYRHLLRDVMRSPPVTARADDTVETAIRRLEADGVSSLLLVDDAAGGGAIVGIVTERDILRILAGEGAASLARPLRAIMSSPVEALPEDAFVYRAIGRMGRRGLRHLAVAGRDGTIVGMITARQILKQRVGGGLALGDAIDTAQGAGDLHGVRNELPALAGRLLGDGLSAREVAGVISAVLRDVSARAAQLAEAETTAAHGPAPSRWCYLVLGSGGRGESLLAADQDNALIHEGPDDPWFAALGRRASEILDQAGIPLCKGGIMAANAPWRGDLAAWNDRVARWLRAAAGEALLNADIFFDFRAVHGAVDLAATLKRSAIEAAADAPLFLRLLADETVRYGPALTLLGGFRTENGRVDLKKGGLMLATGAGRVLALKHRIDAPGTADRLRAVATLAHVPPDDLERLLAAHDTLLGAILRQQIADIAAGIEPSTRVDVQALKRPARARIKTALGDLKLLGEMLAAALK